MAFDLTNLSAKDLDALISNAKQRKVALKKRKPITAVREKIAKTAANEGYSLDELFGTATSTPARKKRAAKKTSKRGTKRAAKSAAPGAPAKRGRPAKAAKASRAGSKVAPKYRNPANPEEVWSGRGMAPRWMAAYIQQGRSKDDFLI